jgi:hypothetical protein
MASCGCFLILIVFQVNTAIPKPALRFGCGRWAWDYEASGVGMQEWSVSGAAQLYIMYIIGP